MGNSLVMVSQGILDHQTRRERSDKPMGDKQAKETQVLLWLRVEGNNNYIG